MNKISLGVLMDLLTKQNDYENQFFLKTSCELCHESELDKQSIRYYEYTNNDDILIRYSICEDCVIHEKKNKGNLGVEVKPDWNGNKGVYFGR